MLTEESLLNMSRKDIMSLAKDRGLKANQATAILMKQLLASNEDEMEDKENVSSVANDENGDIGVDVLDIGVSKISLSPQPRGSVKNGDSVIDSASSTPVGGKGVDASMQLEDTPIMSDTPVTPARMALDDLMAGDAVEVCVDDEWIPGVLKKVNKKTARVAVFNEDSQGKEITVAYPDEIRISDEEEGTWKGVNSVSPVPNKTKTPLSSNKKTTILSPSELASPIVTEVATTDVADEKEVVEVEEEKEVVPIDTSNIDEEWKGDVIEAINDWAACASPMVDVEESTEEISFTASTRANNKTPKAVSMSARTSSTTVTKSSRKSSVGGKKKTSPKASPKIASPIVANTSPKNSTKKSKRKSSGGRKRRSNSSPIVVDAASIVATEEGRMSLMKDLYQENDAVVEQKTIPAPESVSVKASSKVKASSPVQKKVSSPVQKTAKTAKTVKKKTSPIAKIATTTVKPIVTDTAAVNTTTASAMNVVPIEKRPSKHDRDYEVAELPPPSNHAPLAPPKLTKGALLMMESRKKAAEVIEAKQALEKKEKEGKFVNKTIAGASGNNAEKKAALVSNYIPRVAYMGTHNVHSVDSPPNIVYKHDNRRSSGIVPIHQSRKTGFKTGVQKKPIDTLNTLGFTCHTNEEEVQYAMEQKKREVEYTKEKVSRSDQQRADERRMVLALAHRQRMDKGKDTTIPTGNKKVFKARSMPNFLEKHEKGPKFKLTATSNSRQLPMQKKVVVKKAVRPVTAPAASKVKADPPAKKIISKVPFANIAVTASTDMPRTSRASSNVSTVSAVSEQSSGKVSESQDDSVVGSPIEKDGERRRSLRRRTPAKNPFETIAN